MDVKGLSQALWELIKPKSVALSVGVILEATVLEVDETSSVCTVQLTGTNTRIEARLNSVLSGSNDQFTIIPAIKSTVLVLAIENDIDQLSVCQFSVITKVKFGVHGKSFETTKDGHVFNGGQNGGLVKLETLVDRLNRLEDKMKTHQHLTTSPGNPTTPDPASNPLFVNTKKSDLEDSTIKH
jgi:hypothetical protein